MEVYVLRKLKEDGCKEEHFIDIASIICYKNSDKITLHMLDFAEEDSILFDVVKFEVC